MHLNVPEYIPLGRRSFSECTNRARHRSARKQRNKESHTFIDPLTVRLHFRTNNKKNIWQEVAASLLLSQSTANLARMATSTDINTGEVQGSSPPSAAGGHLQSWRLAIVIGTLCLGAFLYGLDANIIGTAIPRITTDFKSLPAVAWYGSSYLLTVTAFQPFFGNLYKFFNAKLVYLASLLIFEGIPTHVSDLWTFLG
jgi:hypothetical protein